MKRIILALIVPALPPLIVSIGLALPFIFKKQPDLSKTIEVNAGRPKSVIEFTTTHAPDFRHWGDPENQPSTINGERYGAGLLPSRTIVFENLIFTNRALPTRPSPDH